MQRPCYPCLTLCRDHDIHTWHYAEAMFPYLTLCRGHDIHTWHYAEAMFLYLTLCRDHDIHTWHYAETMISIPDTMRVPCYPYLTCRCHVIYCIPVTNQRPWYPYLTLCRGHNIHTWHYAEAMISIPDTMQRPWYQYRYPTLCRVGEVGFLIFLIFNFLQLAIDWKNNSKTKVEKMFFFIFMSSYTEMSFLK
jgi:hypothetical protein